MSYNPDFQTTPGVMHGPYLPAGWDEKDSKVLTSAGITPNEMEHVHQLDMQSSAIDYAWDCNAIGTVEANKRTQTIIDAYGEDLLIKLSTLATS